MLHDEVFMYFNWYPYIIHRKRVIGYTEKHNNPFCWELRMLCAKWDCLVYTTYLYGLTPFSISLSGKTSYCRISWNLEAMRLGDDMMIAMCLYFAGKRYHLLLNDFIPLQCVYMLGIYGGVRYHWLNSSNGPPNSYCGLTLNENILYCPMPHDLHVCDCLNKYRPAMVCSVDISKHRKIACSWQTRLVVIY